ncbi:hypothetical protein ACFY0R_37830 [Streptomyces sp. NPDC001633]|uniref:hypothetical protein n=1 Tax=Streptomyces sp. NPDC001633 TaxID=3364595 RepID=UPI003684CC64
MLWIHPNDARGGATRHQGACYGQLADGTIPTYRSGGALYEREFTDHRDADGGRWSGPAHNAPAVPPAALLPACQCGWRGTARPYDPAGGRWGDDDQAHDGQQLDVHAEWHNHAAAALSPAVPHDYRQRLTHLAEPLHELADERPRAALTLVRQLRELADTLEPLAVAGALAHAIPWEVIGPDLGRTKQSVHGRYRTPSQELSKRVADLTGLEVKEFLTRARLRPPRPSGERWTQAVQRIITPPRVTIRRSDDEPPTPATDGRWIDAVYRYRLRDVRLTLHDPGDHTTVASLVISDLTDDDPEAIREYALNLAQAAEEIEAVRSLITEAAAALGEAELHAEMPEADASDEQRHDTAKRRYNTLRETTWRQIGHHWHLHGSEDRAAFNRWFERGGEIVL